MRPYLEITYRIEYTKYFYLKDHLGNIRVTIDEEGDVKEYDDYYPFGLQLPQRTYASGSSNSIYKFSSKEKDGENNLDWYYFGARYYDPEIGRFLSVDRFADMYPSMTPYQYAANNPINFIDVNGDSIWVNYNDADGNAQSLLYTQGMEYSGNNEQVAAVISNLNQMNSINSGNSVLSTLTGSINNYYATFGTTVNSDAAAQYSSRTNTITFAGASEGDIESVAHDFIHAYQDEMGSSPGTIHNEVEAYIFGTGIAYGAGQGSLPFGGDLYSQNMNILVNSDSFSLPNFVMARKLFQSQSATNRTGLYSGKPIVKPGSKYLIKNLYPIW